MSGLPDSITSLLPEPDRLLVWAVIIVLGIGVAKLSDRLSAWWIDKTAEDSEEIDEEEEIRSGEETGEVD